VVVVSKDIKLIDVLIKVVLNFLYIICMWLRNCDLKSI
jgi:hypothetical protein